MKKTLYICLCSLAVIVALGSFLAPLVSGFKEGYTKSMRKYTAEEIVKTAEMLSVMAHMPTGGGYISGISLERSGLMSSLGGVKLDTKLTWAEKPDPKYNTSEVTIKLVNPDPELCEMIFSLAPTEPPKSVTDEAARLGFYISNCF